MDEFFVLIHHISGEAVKYDELGRTAEVDVFFAGPPQTVSLPVDRRIDYPLHLRYLPPYLTLSLRRSLP